MFTQIPLNLRFAPHRVVVENDSEAGGRAPFCAAPLKNRLKLVKSLPLLTVAARLAVQTWDMGYTPD
jgi:hypothetical protein